jgi:hypothetical protein
VNERRPVKILIIVLVVMVSFVLPPVQGASGNLLPANWIEQHSVLVWIVYGVLTSAAVILFVLIEVRGSGTPPDDSADPRTRAAERLAEVVKDQWDREARQRGLLEPEPLLVGHWAPTRRLVADLVADPLADPLSDPLADQSAGQVTAQAGARRLDSVAALVAAFRQEESRRLVVLGEPGAGKTALAVLLTLGLLDGNGPQDPVPVLISVATWNPAEEGLRTWLERRLTEEHPFLRNRTTYGDAAAKRLLHDDMVLPVLDGLDEVVEALQPRAITEIKRAALPRFILTCRAADFQRAVEDGEDVLTGTAVVELEPVRLEDSIDYVRRTSTPWQRERWQPVFDRMRADPDGPLVRTLSSPLMVSLARDVYKKRDSDPQELVERAEFQVRGDRADALVRRNIEAHLLRAFILAAFPDLPRADQPGWTGENARGWLTYLATRMSRHGVRNIAWWELIRLARPWSGVLVGLAGGAMGGLSVGLGVGMVFGTVAGAVVGPVFAVLMGLMCAGTTPPPSDLHFGATGRGRAAALSGLVVGVGGAVIGYLMGGAGLGAAAGAVLAVPIGLVYALSAPDATARAINPRRLLRQDIRVALVFGLVYAFTTGFLGGVAVDPPFGALFGVACGLSGGLLYGPVWALALQAGRVGVVGCVNYFLARVYFVTARRLPWRLMTFLEEAHRRGVLRQVGAVYQFRHAFLQDALTGPPRPPAASASASSGPASSGPASSEPVGPEPVGSEAVGSASDGSGSVGSASDGSASDGSAPAAGAERE